MRVADAMTPRSSLATAEVPGSREDALDHLRDGAFSSVPVVKQTDAGEEVRGLVSRESVLDNPDEDQLALLVEEVPTIVPESSVADASERMLRSRARRVLVASDQLEGIITITDIIREMADGTIQGDVTVGELASRQVTCVHMATPLSVAARELEFAQSSAAIVLDDDGDNCGIITNTDLIAAVDLVDGTTEVGASLAAEDDAWAWEGIQAVGNRTISTRTIDLPAVPVSEIMTNDVVVISRHKTAQDAARTMMREDIEQIPLVNGGTLIGMVHDMDLLKACCDAPLS